MEKHLRILSLVFLFGLISTSVIGQRRECDVPVVTLIPTISHTTCFNSRGSISYEFTGYSGAYVNSLKLFDADGNVVYTQGNNSLSGYIPNLSVGQYRFIGSVVVEYVCDGLTYVTSVPVDLSVWLGIETVWAEKIDMISSPNSYSAKRNATTATYGGVRSSNGIASGDGWIELSAVYGTTTDNRVFLVVGETNPLGVFNPAAAGLQHIEFYKGSGGNGIRVRYLNAGNIWVGGISSDPNDRVRLVRTGTTLSIQLNDDPTNVFTFPEPYSGPMNIAVRTLAINDGCLDVISSFPCRLTQLFLSHAEVKRRLDGGHALAVENSLKFTFDEEYEIASGVYVTYNIYDKDHDVVGSSDGQGNVMTGSTALAYSYDDNRYTLDLSGMNLAQEEYYTLEIIDSKGTKKYLKFLFKY